MDQLTEGRDRASCHRLAVGMAESLVEDFLACFALQQRAIYAFVRSMVFDPADADEVFQETCLALWRDFEKFEPGSDFGAWARQVARYRVLAHGKRHRGDRHRFDSELVEMLIASSEELDDLQVARRNALRDCVGGLDAGDRDLIGVRYGSKRTVEELAEAQSSSVGAMYKRLARIRRRLLACIDRSVRPQFGT